MRLELTLTTGIVVSKTAARRIFQHYSGAFSSRRWMPAISMKRFAMFLQW